MRSEFSRTYARRNAAQISENAGNTKGSAENESPHQENEGISKESPCSASAASHRLAPRKSRKQKTKLKDVGLSESEVTVPRRSRFRGQVRGSSNNNRTITTDTKKSNTEGREPKTKLKDEGLSESEVTVPRCTRFLGQVRGSSDNNRTIIIDTKKLDTQGRKRKTKLKDEGLSESEVTFPRRTCFRGQVRGSINSNRTITTDTKKLDTERFLRYLMHIWDAFPEEKVKSVMFFDPCWFYMYASKNRRTDVVSWIKNKGIFLKKYVFVPIVMWSHWSLLIFCHLGRSLHSKTDAPCMLLLDSSHGTGPTRLESFIRRLLIDIYESEERPESKKQLSKIPLLIPQVPQQRKGDECGFYVLYYVHLFVERSLERFSISEGYPSFMTMDWFTNEEVESFSKTLEALPHPVVSDHDSASMDDSVELIETPFSNNESAESECFHDHMVNFPAMIFSYHLHPHLPNTSNVSNKNPLHLDR